jgi:hypothetical protein
MPHNAVVLEDSSTTMGQSLAHEYDSLTGIHNYSNRTNCGTGRWRVYKLVRMTDSIGVNTNLSPATGTEKGP